MQAQEPIKIDGVGVVVGKNIVLDSDIEKFKLELKNRTEGKVEISDCEMLEQLMLQKLLAHHAVIDSVVVSDAEVTSQVERNIQYFTQEYGSKEKMIKAYGFNDEFDLRNELIRIEKENMLINREQQKITEKIDVTPEEVRIYYNGLKEKGELPQFPAEIQLSELVMKVEPSKDEIERIEKKLNQLKKEIEGGQSFRLKAIINSEDPAVNGNGPGAGGKYTITKSSPFIKEFIQTAFQLEPGQVSEPFESQFGYHLMQLHEVRGDQRDASHILMRPEIPQYKLDEAKAKLERVKQDLEEGTITWEQAIVKHSNGDTRNNNGIMINPYSGDATFDLTRMDPDLYGKVETLKKGDISYVFYEETREGEKMYKIILMRDRTETHTADLVNDYVKVQSLALQTKKQETIEKWSKEKIGDTYIKLGSDYQKCEFKNNWKKESN